MKCLFLKNMTQRILFLIALGSSMCGVHAMDIGTSLSTTMSYTYSEEINTFLGADPYVRGRDMQLYSNGSATKSFGDSLDTREFLMNMSESESSKFCLEKLRNDLKFRWLVYLSPESAPRLNDLVAELAQKNGMSLIPPIFLLFVPQGVCDYVYIDWIYDFVKKGSMPFVCLWINKTNVQMTDEDIKEMFEYQLKTFQQAIKVLTDRENKLIRRKCSRTFLKGIIIVCIGIYLMYHMISYFRKTD